MHEGLKAFGALAKLGRKMPLSSAPSLPIPSPLRREMLAVVREAMAQAGLKGPQREMLLTLLSLRSESEIEEMARLVVAVGQRLALVLPDETGNGNGVTAG